VGCVGRGGLDDYSIDSQSEALYLLMIS